MDAVLQMPKNFKEFRLRIRVESFDRKRLNHTVLIIYTYQSIGFEMKAKTVAHLYEVYEQR